MSDVDRARELLDEMEERMEDLAVAVRGTDSALVSYKMSTLRSTLALLRAYLDESEREDV